MTGKPVSSRFSDLEYWKDDIPDRWHCLVDIFCDLVDFDVTNNKMPEVTLVCVKEKSTQLNIYYNGGDQRTDAYAIFATAMSRKLTWELDA